MRGQFCGLAASRPMAYDRSRITGSSKEWRSTGAVRARWMLPEGVWVATSDELSGLMAQGRTVAEALDIARDVARKLIEARRERESEIPFSARFRLTTTTRLWWPHRWPASRASVSARSFASVRPADSGLIVKPPGVTRSGITSQPSWRHARRNASRDSKTGRSRSSDFSPGLTSIGNRGCARAWSAYHGPIRSLICRLPRTDRARPRQAPARVVPPDRRRLAGFLDRRFPGFIDPPLPHRPTSGCAVIQDLGAC